MDTYKKHKKNRDGINIIITIRKWLNDYVFPLMIEVANCTGGCDCRKVAMAQTEPEP